ncbi:ABC transporter substrate-binding protein [Anaerocolumna jejuensis]|uniref:ABC transporter substrate-binding protein n=1 Tax=Anaerocolumna jejuensis TaxID=259063 RepID=UPI003F7C4911
MKLLKRLAAGGLVAAMSLSLVACGGGNGGKSDSAKEPEKKVTKIVYAYLSFNNIPEDLSDVETAINNITRDKIGVEVELMPLSVANYTQQINLAMQGGEQVDVFHSLGDFNQYVTRNQAYDLTDIIDSCAKEAKDAVGENMMKVTTQNNKIYGIPANKGVALAPNFIYRQDIMDELGVDASTIKSINDLAPIFEKLKEKHPDMTPLAPVNPGDSGILNTIFGVDYLTDDYLNPKGVLMGDSTKVEDFYQTDAFKEKVNLARDWYSKGYILKDAVTTTSSASELISGGSAFSYIANYGGTSKDVANQLTSQTGQKIGAVRLGSPYLDTSSVNSITWMISSTTKNPEAALKFLNLTYSDPEIVNLIVYGIEGKDYVKVDDSTVTWPEGLDASTVPYTAQLSCGIIGSQFAQYTLKGTDKESLKLMEEENKNAASSKAFGFIFDSSPVKNEYTSVINVINQYLPVLRCGSVDPVTELPDFIAKLKEAGMDKIIAEKQKQLDAYLAENK